MSNFETLDRSLLQSVKKAFVAMPAGSGGPGPVAGGGMLTQAQAAPMGGDPAAAGGAPPMDPAMAGGGMPMDPAAMGGMPPGGDPAAMGGDPAAGGMPPIDPAMLASLMGGGAGGAPAPAQAPGMITLSVQDLIALMQSGGSKPKAKAEGAGGAAGAGGGDMGAKLDQIISLLGGNMTGGAAPAPAPGAAPAGAPPQQ
jgi:hypothetical protein